MAGFPTSENRLVADLKFHRITIMSNYRVFLNSYQALRTTPKPSWNLCRIEK
jgi:hypothetical protein